MVQLFGAALYAQNRSVSGKVTDPQGKVIAGASVLVRGTTIGTSTNSEGNFSLSVPAESRVLVISSVGYQNVEVTIGNQTNLAIALGTTQTAMDELVVVAYGTARRQTFTGAATQIKSDEIGRQQISNLTRSLEGLVPGLKTSAGSGQPGAGSNVRIRGISSISSSNAPLYVVDGVPYGGDINAINPIDVESMTILKDAASAALYGARGANGVIMITTKRGKGKPRFDLVARYGINGRAVPEYDVIRDPGQFLELYWRALKHEAMYRATGPLNDAAASTYASNNLIAKVGGYNPFSVANTAVIDPATGKLNPAATLRYYDDWEDALFENRPRQEYVGTLSGSSDKTRYYFSLGYLNDKGYVVKSDFNRVNGRLNLEQELNRWLRFGVNGSYAATKTQNTQEQNTAYQNPFYFTRAIAPIYPVYLRDASGNFIYDARGDRQFDFGNGVMGTRQFVATENPLATLEKDVNSAKNDNLSARTFAEIRFLPELKLTVNYGMDLYQTNTVGFQNPLYGSAINVSGRGTVASGRDLTTNINQLLNYTKSFGEHNFDVLLGHESYRYLTTTLSGTKENFLIPDNPQLGNAVTIQSLTSTENTYAVEGYFGQVKYDLQNKYLLSASIRRDGSSRFAPEHRWGTFWSVGAGYVISEENFMKDIKTINMLKLKASYGIRGNDALGVGSFYPYQNQYTVVNNNGQLGLLLTYWGRREISWEKNKDLDVGADFRLFNRVSGSFDWFKRETYDLLYNVPQPLSPGPTALPENVARMENWGFETELNFDIVRNRDWKVQLGINASRIKNKITDMPAIYKEKGIATNGAFNKLQIGHNIGEFFMIEYVGVDNLGRALYNKDEIVGGVATGKKITTTVSGDATRYWTGKTPMNDLFGGIDASVQYRNFDFSVLTSYAIGGYVHDSPYAALMYAGGGDVTTWHKDILKSWTPANTNTDIPKLQENYQDANAISTRFLTKASYFNIRNVTLGFSLPTKFTESWSLGATRFYLAADNVILFSERKGLDPRHDFAGSVNNAYSPIRTISFGISTSF
jgi:TonB-linked SusC/RagA family outer membrane protein